MPPWPERDDLVLIGLLGGSVAQEAAPHFQRALSRYFAANNLPRRPVVLGMGYKAVKQPQQVIIAANTLLMGGHFDIIVNLDGFNEKIFPIEDYRREEHPFFVYFWSSLAGLTVEDLLLAGRIGILREQQTGAAPDAASAPGFERSAVFGLFRRYRRESRARQIIRLNHELVAGQAVYSLERQGPQAWFPQEDELTAAAVRVWYRSSLLLAAAAELAAAEYYHFLQPNQYVPGSKTLTAEELACCYAAGGHDEGIYRKSYPLLTQLGAELPGPAVNYFDLSYIFRGNGETLYKDDSGHFNDRGNELLAAAMVARMAPALHRASTAAAPPSGLAAAARPEPEQLLIIDAEWQVYRRGRYWLVYDKDGCTPEDRAAWFFLHIVPVNRSDLPANRREHGFDNQDFRFDNSNGGVINGRCVVERRLPDYPIASIRTGQYIYGGDKLWAGEYRFVE